MSKETLTRCDRCGRVMLDDTEQVKGMAAFYRSGWGETIDLCRECADEVQKFIAKGVDDGEHR